MTPPSLAPLDNSAAPEAGSSAPAARPPSERRALRWLFSGAFAICGCSLLVDASDIDAGCPEGWKDCNGCVPVRDPKYGCNDSICDICALENAEPECSDDGRCVIARCLWGFGCPTSNGCMTPILGDPKNCGGCNVQCPEGWLCQLGECVASLSEVP